MYTRSLLRSSQPRLSATLSTKPPSSRLARPFHSTAAAMVKEGDAVPNVELFESSPGNRVNLSKELASGKGLVIGVPAAFSPTCTGNHVPGYIASDKLKTAGKVFVVSVNDAWVTNAWGKTLDENKSSGIRFIADPAGEFTKTWDVAFDTTAITGNYRSKRYAIATEDGKVVKVAIEPDNTSLTISAADKFL